MRSRILAMEYSYEYNKGPVPTIGNRVDRFFRFDMLETVYDGEVLH